MAECAADPIGATTLVDEGARLATAPTVACRSRGGHARHPARHRASFSSRRLLAALRLLLHGVRGAALRLRLRVGCVAGRHRGRVLVGCLGAQERVRLVEPLVPPMSEPLSTDGTVELGTLRQELAWLVGPTSSSTVRIREVMPNLKALGPSRVCSASTCIKSGFRTGKRAPSFFKAVGVGEVAAHVRGGRPRGFLRERSRQVDRCVADEGAVAVGGQHHPAAPLGSHQ
mmetsp:Transcript_97672/g.285114  ORF Transcript_97672/g.285114 Transcript_97672/m.285114 type:complete len:229 (-) Transcript_97672:84-770(-)